MDNQRALNGLESKMMHVESLIRAARALHGAEDSGAVRALLTLAQEEMIDAFTLYYEVRGS